MNDYEKGRNDAVDWIEESLFHSGRASEILEEGRDPKNIAGQARKRNRELYEKTLNKV